MKKKDEKAYLPSELDLNLPSDAEFISTAPEISAVEMAKHCEAMLPYWNKRRFIDGIETGAPVNREFVL